MAHVNQHLRIAGEMSPNQLASIQDYITRYAGTKGAPTA